MPLCVKLLATTASSVAAGNGPRIDDLPVRPGRPDFADRPARAECGRAAMKLARSLRRLASHKGRNCWRMVESAIIDTNCAILHQKLAHFDPIGAEVWSNCLARADFLKNLEGLLCIKRAGHG